MSDTGLQKILNPKVARGVYRYFVRYPYIAQENPGKRPSRLEQRAKRRALREVVGPVKVRRTESGQLAAFLPRHGVAVSQTGKNSLGHRIYTVTPCEKIPGLRQHPAFVKRISYAVLIAALVGGGSYYALSPASESPHGPSKYRLRGQATGLSEPTEGAVPVTPDEGAGGRDPNASIAPLTYVNPVIGFATGSRPPAARPDGPAPGLFQCAAFSHPEVPFDIISPHMTGTLVDPPKQVQARLAGDGDPITFSHPHLQRETGSPYPLPPTAQMMDSTDAWTLLDKLGFGLEKAAPEAQARNLQAVFDAMTCQNRLVEPLIQQHMGVDKALPPDFTASGDLYIALAEAKPGIAKREDRYDDYLYLHLTLKRDDHGVVTEASAGIEPAPSLQEEVIRNVPGSPAAHLLAHRAKGGTPIVAAPVIVVPKRPTTPHVRPETHSVPTPGTAFLLLAGGIAALVGRRLGLKKPAQPPQP